MTNNLCIILRNIIHDSSNYCCLCFEAVEEGSYNLQDEVVFYTQSSQSAENVYEILSNVLGTHVLDSLSVNTICRKCTETAIISYKFIEMCKNNVQNLACTIDCLQKYTKSTSKGFDCYKSLFLVLDTDNSTVKYIYDKKQHGQNEPLLLKRLQLLNRKPRVKKIKKNSKALLSVNVPDVFIPQVNEHETNYRCEHCGKEYPTILKSKQHYLRVHAPKNFKCSKCLRSFGASFLLKRHTKDSHCTVVCIQCGKTYNNTYSLRHHERSHKLRLICQTCGKVYKGKQAFNNHIEKKLCEKMRKSNAEAKFTCDYCEKKYSQKTALSVHIRLEHENGKALICDWCGKKLSSISKLKDHTLKHTKQKNFNCDICGGKFVTKASLLYHTRTHTGEKPYKCNQCDMRFLSASRRSEHVKRHHTEPDLECDICQGKFKGQTCLTRHRKRHFDASSRLYCNSSSQSINEA